MADRYPSLWIWRVYRGNDQAEPDDEGAYWWGWSSLFEFLVRGSTKEEATRKTIDLVRARSHLEGMRGSDHAG